MATIQEQARENLAACMVFSLRRAARAVTQLYDERLRAKGLRATQFNLLILLAAAGPCRMTELAEAGGMNRTTLTRNLRLLEARRLIRRKPGADRRERLVEVLPAGIEVAMAAFPLWQQAQADLAQALDDEEPGVLRGRLAKLEDAARRL